MDDHALTQDTTRRLLIWIAAIIQGVFLFFAAQATLRIFALRDLLNEVQTEVARIEVRQKSNTDLMQAKLDHLQSQVDRLDAQRRGPDGTAPR